MKYAALCLILAIPFIAPYLRAPFTTPTKPSVFDLDMDTLQIAHAPKDADILFFGDSITQRWSYREAILQKYFPGYKIANLGVGGSCVDNVLWILENEKLDFHPKEVVLLVGTNDIEASKPRFYQKRAASPQQIADGIQDVVNQIHAKWPQANIVLMALFPRFIGNNDYKVNQVNQIIRNIPGVHFIDLSHQLNRSTTLDGLHLTDSGYEIWAKALSQESPESATLSGHGR